MLPEQELAAAYVDGHRDLAYKVIELAIKARDDSRIGKLRLTAMLCQMCGHIGPVDADVVISSNLGIVPQQVDGETLGDVERRRGLMGYDEPRPYEAA